MVDERTNIRFIIAVASWIVVLIGSIFLLEPAHMGSVVGCFTLTLIGWLMVSAKL
jgi:hypothetical protein